jgi:hypothetical protein
LYVIFSHKILLLKKVLKTFCRDSPSFDFAQGGELAEPCGCPQNLGKGKKSNWQADEISLTGREVKIGKPENKREGKSQTSLFISPPCEIECRVR